MKNILTIDMEDWYQGIEIDFNEWPKYEDRIERSIYKLLDILHEEGIKATFFVLGYVADKLPRIVREVAANGHEVGTHGYGHGLVYKMTPAQFATDLKKSIDCIEQSIGCAVKGYRAPYFSITRDSIWALDILVQNGIEYDSSIFPIINYRYGIPDSPGRLYYIKTQSGLLLEVPVSTVEIFGKKFSFTGGFYMRFFHYNLIRWAIKKINEEGQPAVIYLHPWELDYSQPRINLPLRIKLTHYHNLGTTEGKLRRLLQAFRFSNITSVVLEKRDFPVLLAQNL